MKFIWTQIHKTRSSSGPRATKHEGHLDTEPQHTKVIWTQSHNTRNSSGQRATSHEVHLNTVPQHTKFIWTQSHNTHPLGHEVYLDITVFFILCHTRTRARAHARTHARTHTHTHKTKKHSTYHIPQDTPHHTTHTTSHHNHTQPQHHHTTPQPQPHHKHQRLTAICSSLPWSQLLRNSWWSHTKLSMAAPILREALTNRRCWSSDTVQRPP